MKSRDTHVRLQRFHVEERRRRVAQIEAMINEFARMAAELDREIALEEQRAGISDLSHFAYPTYARAARARRDNLMCSSAELRGQLDDAKANLETALAELSKVQTLEGRDKSIDRADGPEQGRTLDQLGLRAAQA
ncbi:flagellar export protein FliJ [Methylovirgula sp. HY1]|uniref:flagellar export protein FliJ n=1 Tax=Methylovirgula sp. HY1 TaxID=2822761 RepID=UPI001C5A7D36|nr:flagellar export protein FliJ [Methylovirgula sp. HY1]